MLGVQILAALKVEWDEGPHARLTTDDIAGELERATLNTGAVAQNIGNVDIGMARAAKSWTSGARLGPALVWAASDREPRACAVLSLTTQ